MKYILSYILKSLSIFELCTHCLACNYLKCMYHKHFLTKSSFNGIIICFQINSCLSCIHYQFCKYDGRNKFYEKTNIQSLDKQIFHSEYDCFDTLIVALFFFDDFSFLLFRFERRLVTYQKMLYFNIIRIVRKVFGREVLCYLLFKSIIFQSRIFMHSRIFICGPSISSSRPIKRNLNPGSYI